MTETTMYAGPGQPTKFTEEVKEKILVAVRKGAPYEIACDYAGISYHSLNNWRKISLFLSSLTPKCSLICTPIAPD